MRNESKDIREILNDVGDIINKMSVNESFTFGEKMPSNQSSNTSPIKKQTPNEDINSELELPLNNEKPVKGVGVGEKVKQIRKIAIEAIADLDPSLDPDSYKMIKNIWDSCDKYLTKDISVKPKEEIKNNI